MHYGSASVRGPAFFHHSPVSWKEWNGSRRMGMFFSCLSGFVMHRPQGATDRVLLEALAPIDDMLYSARRERAGFHGHRFLTPVRRTDPEAPCKVASGFALGKLAGMMSSHHHGPDLFFVRVSRDGLGAGHDAFNVHVNGASRQAAAQKENMGCERVLSGLFAWRSLVWVCSACCPMSGPREGSPSPSRGNRQTFGWAVGCALCLYASLHCHHAPGHAPFLAPSLWQGGSILGAGIPDTLCH